MSARFFLFSLFLFSQFPLWGSGFELYLLGSRSLAMGQTGTAYPLDGSSLFFNPGASAFQAPQILMGGAFSVPQTAYAGPNPSTEISFSEPAYLSPFYFYGIFRPVKNSPLRLGISVNSPFGQALRWPKTWRGRFISQESNRSSLFIQPTVSYRLGTQWGLGLGLVIARSNFLFRRAFWAPFPPSGVDPSASLSGSGMSMGWNAGIYFRPSSSWQFGFNYHSSLRFNQLRGTVAFDVPAAESSQYPDIAFGTSMPLPASLALGIAHAPQDGIWLCLEVHYTGWQVLDSIVFQFEEALPNNLNFDSHTNWQAAWSYRMGAEILISRTFRLMLGSYFDTSPVQEGFVSPELPDANRIGLTGGLTIQLSPLLEIDVAAMFETTGERTATFIEKGFAGIYQTNTGAISMGIKYAFSDR